MVAKSSKNAEIIRPILRGRDIKRYGYEFADLWLLYIPWHFPLHTNPSITGASEKAEVEFQENYPDIYNHLLKYKEQLSNRNKAETGIRYEWYALQRWGANYMDDFSKQKIAWGNLALNCQFAIIKEGYCINAPSAFFATEDLYLLAILNSSISNYYIKSLGVTRSGGYFEYKPMFVEKMPIPQIPEKEKEIFINIVKEIDREYNRDDRSLLEKEINKLTYKLYSFTQEEIDFIESV